jgi:putative ABC transport system permease protein
LRVGWRYLLRHPWQSVLMIVGITLGVAVAVAIDLANVSASRAFDLSTAAVVGRATHNVVGGPQGIDEALYTRLRQQGITLTAPIIAEYVSSPQLGDSPLQLLGIDPFAEAPFRNYLYAQGSLPLGELGGFFVQPDAVLLSTGQAQRFALDVGSRLELDVAGLQRTVTVVGLLPPADSLSGRLLENVILADLATVQELTNRLGRLDRIDVIIPSDDRALAGRLTALLPEGVRLLPVAARSGVVEDMTAAFRTNLTALSMLALLVGMFLIYNTMTFSVIQRRPLFGTLRCLGVTRSELFLLVASEALIVGVIGAALGLALGVALGQGTVRLVTQTINDLYFAVNVRDVALPLQSLIKGAVLGIGATALTAALPAWEAAASPPRQVLSRSGLEAKARSAVLLAAVAGVALLAIGAALLVLPTRSLIVSFAGTLAVVVGFAMLTPLTMSGLMRLAGRLTGRLWGVLGRMAPRNVVNALSRTAVAIAALMIAVSVTIGVSVMVSSFRYTVATWLQEILRGDIYITAPSVTATQSTVPLDERLLPLVVQWPGVVRADTLRSTEVDSPLGPVQIMAVQNPDFARIRTYIWSDRPIADLWQAMQDGAVIVSEPFANRLGLRRGQTVTLYTDRGEHVFAVAGVFYDYTSSQGMAAMTLDTYRRLWNDQTLTSLALHVAPDVDAERIQRELQTAVAPLQRLLVRPNRALRQDVLVVFDRTFAITSALQLLATVVAFVGVLSALLSLELEKQREMGVLRAIGLTGRQLWGLIFLETGLMGAVAGVLAMPTGLAISTILIYVINSRSFGWTLQMRADPAPFVQAMVVAVVAALLAAIYPARRMDSIVTAEALRYE